MATHSIGKLYVELDLDAAKFTNAQKKIIADSQKTAFSVESNFKTLGTKSDFIFDSMRKQAENAYNGIARNAKSSASEIARAQQGLAAKMKSINDEQYGSSSSTIAKIKTNWIAGMAAIAAAGVALNIGKSFLDAGIAAESMQKGLTAALGTVHEAAKAEQFLRQESERLGLVFMDQVKSYKSLAAAAKGTALEGEETKKIFTAVTTASTALGLSAEETSGSLMAIQQMMSKGTVQAEELRGQLSERLPGAFGMVAEAMGVTTAELGKMLEHGEVMATDMLPKLADALINRYGQAATDAADLTQQNLNRMNTAFTDLKVTIIDVFLPAISSAFSGLTNLIRLFPNLAKAIDLAQSGMISFSDIVTANGKELNDLVNNVDPLAAKIAEIKNRIDELANGPMAWRNTVEVGKLRAELTKLEAAQVSLRAKSDFGKMKDGWLAFYEGAEKAANQKLPAISEAHDKTTKKAIDHTKDFWEANFDDRYEIKSRSLDREMKLEKEYIEEGKKLGEDMWLSNEKERNAATDRAIQYEIDEQKNANDEIGKLYDEMWRDMRKAYSDIIYDMLQGDLDSWDDYFQAIKSMFLRLIAEMVALWSINFIKGIFSGTGSFSLASIFGTTETSAESSILSIAGLTAGVDSLTSSIGGLFGATQAVENGMYAFGVGAEVASTGVESAVVGMEAATASSLALAGALLPLGIAIGGMMGLDDMLFGDGPSAEQVLSEYEAGIRDLTEEQEAYWKMQYMGMSDMLDFYTGDLLDGTKQLTGVYSDFMNLNLTQMSRFKQLVADLEMALAMEAGTLMFDAVDVASSEEIMIQMEELMAEFKISPSDEWYDLVVQTASPGYESTQYTDNPNGYAAGGSPPPNSLILVGEQGPELMKTGSGATTIFSNPDTMRMMAMGIPGYASGTTDITYTSSGTAETDMWNDLIEKTEDYLNLLGDLGSELDDLNEYYTEQIALAESLGVTSEELAQIYAMQEAAQQELIDQWTEETLDAYAEMMGMTSGLNQEIRSITDQFADWSKDVQYLIDSGYLDESAMQVLKLAEAAAILSTTKRYLDDATQGFEDLQMSMIGWAQSLYGSDLWAAYETLEAWRNMNGYRTTGDLNDILNFTGMNPEDLQEYAGELEKFFASLAATLEEAYESVMQTQESIRNSIHTLNLSMMDSAKQAEYYSKHAMDAYNNLGNMSSEEQAQAIEWMHTEIMAYYDAQKQAIQERYQTEIDAINEAADSFADLINVLDKINDKIFDLKYSGYNLALPQAKAEVAKQDYATMLAAAQSSIGTGDTSAIDDLLSFVDTYLQSGQDAYKSSQAYLDMYAQVQSDLAAMGLTIGGMTNGKTVEELTEIQNGLIDDLNEQMQSEIDQLTQDVITALDILNIAANTTREQIGNELLNLYYMIDEAQKAVQVQMVTDSATLALINTALSSSGSIYIKLEEIRAAVVASGTSKVEEVKSVASSYFPTINTTGFSIGGGGAFSPKFGFADGGISSGPLSGYPAMLHGTELIVPLNDPKSARPSSSESDPEVKALLRELVSATKAGHVLTIDGQAIDSRADRMVVSRINRGMINDGRRLVN